MVLVGQNEALGVNYVATPGGFAAYGIAATPEGVTEAAVIAARDPSADSANLELEA